MLEVNEITDEDWTVDRNCRSPRLIQWQLMSLQPPRSIVTAKLHDATLYKPAQLDWLQSTLLSSVNTGLRDLKAVFCCKVKGGSGGVFWQPSPPGGAAALPDPADPKLWGALSWKTNMEGKVIKEELPDKDSTPSSASYSSDSQRRTKGVGKERCRSPGSPGVERSPDGSPASGGAPRASPHLNGSAGSASPVAAGGEGGAGRPPPARLKRFLATLVQFACDMGADVGERVRSLVHNLVSSAISVEEFQQALQEATNFPLRPFVPPFLRAALPPLQREVLALARQAKQAPLQYVRGHEAVALEAGGAGEAADMFLAGPPSPGPNKRPAPDTFYDASITQSNGLHHGVDSGDYQPPAKRPHPTSLLVNPSPLLFPLQTHSHLFEYPHPYHINFQNHSDNLASNFEMRREGGVAARDGVPPSLTSVEQRTQASNMAAGLNMSTAPNAKNDEEWKNINTMLNCILSMVEKTKRALAILQQRGNGAETYSEGAEIKRAAGEIMAATVRQTEERVAEVRRRAEEAVNQVKRQAVAELQRAAAAERARLERLLRLPASRRATSQSPPPPDHHNTCWNCGRKAQETCSGCNVARYCGAFCQHKDWENHHQVCCGRDQKPPSSALLTVTSPPSGQPPKPSQITRATTPVSSSTPNERLNLSSDRIALNTDNRLSLSSLNNAERLLTSVPQDRINLSIAGVQNERISLAVSQSSERLGLAGIGGQGLVGGVGGKK